MATVTAQTVFKELEKGTARPFYLVVGEEPFQTREITEKLKSFFLKGDDVSFNYEHYDGEDGRIDSLMDSLQLLPGLFSDASSTRLVYCSRIEKMSSSALEKIESYLKDPVESTCFVMSAAKADKRKGWYKTIESKGAVIEVSEPSDRDWPRWQVYFENKTGKRFHPSAWPLLVASSGHMLSIVATEVEKAVGFLGNKETLDFEDAKRLFSNPQGADVFEFAEDVVYRRKKEALFKFERLILGGENEIKLLAILVRQFRMVHHCLELMEQGVNDSKVLAPQIGSHPFFVSKVQAQAKKHSKESLEKTLSLLTTCDFKMKTGSGGLFETFLAPYFM